MELSEIKRFLDRGDYVKIARLVGYENLTTGRKTVYRVLTGNYPQDSFLARDIIKNAEKVATQNQENGKKPNSEAKQE